MTRLAVTLIYLWIALVTLRAISTYLVACVHNKLKPIIWEGNRTLFKPFAFYGNFNSMEEMHINLKFFDL